MKTCDQEYIEHITGIGSYERNCDENFQCPDCKDHEKIQNWDMLEKCHKFAEEHGFNRFQYQYFEPGGMQFCFWTAQYTVWAFKYHDEVQAAMDCWEKGEDPGVDCSED